MATTFPLSHCCASPSAYKEESGNRAYVRRNNSNRLSKVRLFSHGCKSMSFSPILSFHFIRVIGIQNVDFMEGGGTRGSGPDRPKNRSTPNILEWISSKDTWVSNETCRKLPQHVFGNVSFSMKLLLRRTKSGPALPLYEPGLPTGNVPISATIFPSITI